MTYFKENQRYVDRLISQWKEHGTLILAVDYDDTIFPGKVNSVDLVSKTIKLLKTATSEFGFKIVIFTARNKAYFKEIEEYCKFIDLKISAINEDIVKLDSPTSGKIYYNVLLDDKSGLEQTMDIVQMTMDIIKHLK